MEIKLPRYFKYILVLLGAILLIWLLQMFKSVLMPMAFAVLFALLLLPMTRDMEKFNIPRPIAIMISIILVIVILGLVVWFLSMQVVSLTSELETIGQNFDMLLMRVQDYLYRNFDIAPANKSDFIKDAISNLRELSTSFVGSTISMTTGVLATFTIVPIFVFCLLYYRDHLEQFMFKFVAKESRHNLNTTITSIQHVIQSYISGLMIVIMIVALLNSAGLLLLDVKYAIFFGIFASILTIIPYIGILIGALLPALFTLASTGNLIDALLVVGVFVFVQFLEGNFITPLVVGTSVSINPFAAIVALLIGGEIWGAAGMILSIPVIATLKVLFDAYPPLSPFGFLLADIDENKPRKKSKVRSWFSEVWNGISRGKRNS